MTILPIMARENFTAVNIHFVQSPWGAPLTLALSGTNNNEQPWLVIANESPTSWLRVGAPVPKPEMELLHLQRLAVDHRCATGHELYDAVTPVPPGADPPDLYAHIGNTQVGWELTTFSNPQRRQAQALFFEVTKRLINQQRHRIGHLAGYHISMWFGAADDPAGLPFKVNDASAYDRIVDALITYHPEPNQYRLPGNQAPQIIEFQPVRTPDEVNFISVPLLGGVPASGIFSMTGMSAGLAFQSDHIAPDEWTNLRELIRRKDKPANNRLLISTGAPDTLGRCFISEEVLAQFLLENFETVSATHLSSVIVHFWSTGRAVEILGAAPMELWPALYQGFTPAAHPFVMQSR